MQSKCSSTGPYSVSLWSRSWQLVTLRSHLTMDPTAPLPDPTARSTHVYPPESRALALLIDGKLREHWRQQSRRQKFGVSNPVVHVPDIRFHVSQWLAELLEVKVFEKQHSEKSYAQFTNYKQNTWIQFLCYCRNVWFKNIYYSESRVGVPP